MEEYQIFVISARRTGNVAQVQESVPDCIWLVPDEEVKDYEKAGADKVIPAGNSLVSARNKALEIASDYYCVQISDDLEALSWRKPDMSTQGKTITETAEMMVTQLAKSPYYLAGIAPTDNAYFATNRIAKKGFCIGDFFVVKPNSEIRFDDRFLLKEDYDFTLQHFTKYGGLLRFDFVLASFKHYSNQGGVVAYRNSQVEAEMISLLQKKWGKLVKLNPKRENEVLLYFPKV